MPMQKIGSYRVKIKRETHPYESERGITSVLYAKGHLITADDDSFTIIRGSNVDALNRMGWFVEESFFIQTVIDKVLRIRL